MKGYKAELSSLSARTKLMPLWYKQRKGWILTAAALCCLGASHFAGDRAFAAEDGTDDFDHQSRKFFIASDAVPEPYLTADSGDRNLAGYYQLRQYPGSPPRIPHPADQAFSGDENDCLSCHAKGGYSAEFGKFVPVTPHPENSLCYQCHARQVTEATFVPSTWQSICTAASRLVVFARFAAIDTARPAAAGKLYRLPCRAGGGGGNSRCPCASGLLPAVSCAGRTAGCFQRIPEKITSRQQAGEHENSDQWYDRLVAGERLAAPHLFPGVSRHRSGQ